MFEVRVPEGEDREVIKKAVYEFVLDANDEMDQEDNPISQKFDSLKKKTRGIGSKQIDKVKEQLEGLRFAVEETEKGFRVINPFTSAVEDLPMVGGTLGISLKGFMRQSRKALKESLEEMRYCEDCDSIREEDECSKCGSETRDFDFKVR